jgi:5'-methylthioadenosine phosphorylase
MENETIGIFGGSGFYDFAEAAIEERKVHTPFGAPSDKLAITSVAGHRVVFLPRHGRDHSIPPHLINYRANLWAMKELGATIIIAPSAVGSLQPDIAPGDFVINDQFVDRTSGRKDTFYDGSEVVHVSTAEPYCPALRRLAIDAARSCGAVVHETGTAVTIQGPRFSTKAESRWFGSMGWSVVGMTQYPEVALARELALCYVAISLVTDYDTGVQVEGGSAGHVETIDVVKVMQHNVATVKRVIRAMIERLPTEGRSCLCSHALDNAKM